MIAHLVASVVFLAIASLVLWQSWPFQYMTSRGPGPGFFPIWVGSLLMVLSVALCIQAWIGAVELPEPQLLPEPDAIGRIVSVLAALILFAWALERIGYSLAAFMFSFGLFLLIGGARLIISLPLAIACSGGLYYVFRYMLGVRLPESPLGLLSLLGF